MGIETGDTIASLNPLWPLETDPTHEGNDHLQLIKDVIKTTFQGGSGTGWSDYITVDPTEINYLDGATSNIQTQIDNLSSSTSNLIKIVDTNVVAGQDDNALGFKIETSGVNGVVQEWEDGGTQVATVMNALNVIDLIYPVGSVFHSTTNANPGDRFTGTTWAAVGEGRFIASVGTHTDGNGDEVTLAAGDITAGEYNHTLTEAEMPAHTHTFEFWPGAATGGTVRDSVDSHGGSTKTTTSAGSDGAHNNIPPGYAMYIWERTA